MDAETGRDGSGPFTTDDEEVNILNTLNSEFRQSKAEQIFRFLQDQEDLSQKFKEYALNSEDEGESDGSVGEAETRLSHQLDLHRVRPSNPPQAAWSDLARLGGDSALNEDELNENSNLYDDVNPEYSPGLQVNTKSKRKGSSRSGDINTAKTKRTLSKVATRPQTAVGLRSIEELAPSAPSPLPINSNVTASLLDGRLTLDNYDGVTRQPYHHVGMVIRNPSHPTSVSRRNRVKPRGFRENGGSFGQNHTEDNCLESDRVYGSVQSAPTCYQHGRHLQRTIDPLDYSRSRGNSGASTFMDFSSGQLNASGRLRLTGRPDVTQKLIKLDVSQPNRTLHRDHSQERQFDGRHSVTSGRESVDLYRNNAGATSNGGRLLRAPVLTNLPGMEQGGRNMAVLKLPPLENNVVTSANLSSNPILNTPSATTLNPTHVAH